LFVIYMITIAVFHLLSSILLYRIEDILHVLFLFIIYQILILLRSYVKTVMMNAEVNIYMSSVTLFEGRK
jgi:hypothetical protein